MDAKKLVELRREAEKAVADMADGELKIKAFEVILAQLLGRVDVTPEGPTKDEKRRRPMPDVSASTKSTSGRILVLRDQGFFRNQRTIGDIREELSAHGWHYPLTTLSARLQELVQKRKLRRVRAKQGNKRIWKYSNP